MAAPEVCPKLKPAAAGAPAALPPGVDVLLGVPNEKPPPPAKKRKFKLQIYAVKICY